MFTIGPFVEPLPVYEPNFEKPATPANAHNINCLPLPLAPPVAPKVITELSGAVPFQLEVAACPLVVNRN